MRRIVALATLIALAATLLVPLAAFAKGGPPAGKGPGSVPPGQAKKAAAALEQSAEPAEETPAPGEKEARKAAKAAAKAEKSATKAEEKVAKSAAKAERKSGAAAAVAASADESDTPSVDESATLEPGAPAKLTGIANALSRIMANIERAEAKVAAGQKSQVPPGLLKVMAKFLGWLGIEAEPDTDTDEPGSADPGLTDPGEGSDEDTSTPIPDSGSEEDTATIEPEIED